MAAFFCVSSDIYIENNRINIYLDMNKKLIRLTESDLHNIVKESVYRILKEDGYSYNGIDYQQGLRDKINNQTPTTQVGDENIYNQNKFMLRKVFIRLLKEYDLINRLEGKVRVNVERYSYVGKIIEKIHEIFSFVAFFSYVKEIANDKLYQPMDEKECESIVDEYIDDRSRKIEGKIGKANDYGFP